MKCSVQKCLVRGLSSSSSLCSLPASSLKTNFYNSDQVALMDSTKRLVEEVINPHWQEWQQQTIFPAKQVFKKFGDAGMLGIHRDTQFGGQGLSYKYNVAFLEALGHSLSPGVSMAIGK